MLDLPPTSPSSPGTLRAYARGPITPRHITVLGAGAFGSALAFVLSRTGHYVKVLDVVESRIVGINTVREDGKRYNPDFLKQYPLPETFVGVYDPAEAFSAETEFIFSAIPIQFCFDYLTKIKPFIYREHIEGFVQTKPLYFVSLSKGIALDKLELIHQVYERVFDISCADISKAASITEEPKVTAKNHSAIFGDAPSRAVEEEETKPKLTKLIPIFASGGSFADEVASNLYYTGLTLASPCLESARIAAELLNQDEKTVCSISTDYIGVQLAGALKNVYAIGAGMIQGLYPERYNTFSAYVTLAAAELRRVLTTVWGADATTMSGFAGIGDFVLSCSGPSRNRSIGIELAQTKMRLSELMAKSPGVVEGIPTTKALHSILLEKEYLRQCPIVRTIYAVLFNNQPVVEAVDFLFSLPVQSDYHQ